MIKLENASVFYGKKQALRGVSASLDKGKLVSVIGPNGSGKSTLLKSVCGIIPLAEGRVIADGVPLDTLKPKETAKRIAYLAQGKNTPDMTVSQLVLHGRFPHLSYPRRYSEKDTEKAFSAMEQAGVSDAAHSPLKSLSGGMRQNAYIAMALAQDTEYILLDEPTTYLDIAHQLSLMKTLKRLSESGRGITAVMHDLPLAFNFSDTVIILSAGKNVFCGTPSEAVDSGIVRDIFGVSLFRLPGGEYVYDYKLD